MAVLEAAAAASKNRTAAPPAPTPERSLVVPTKLVYALLVAGSLLILALAWRTAPAPFAIGFGLLCVVLVAWFVKPLLGLCLTVTAALISDSNVMSWYPANKGFSARESMLFLADAAIISPLELCLITGLLALFVRYLVLGTWPFRLGRRGWAAYAFVGVMIMAFFRGATSGGDRHTGLLQLRPFVAFAVVFLLTTSICRRNRDYAYVLIAVITAIVVHAIIALQHLRGLPASRLELTETLIDHGAAVRMNVLIVLVIATWSWGLANRLLRWALTLTLVPVVWVYMLAQRRSAFVALIVGFTVLACALLWTRRRTFFKIVPIVAILLIGYTAAFWGSEGAAAGFPAQAIKSAISPDDVSERNASSDLYRIIENFDLHYTIRAEPILGIGLGKAFYQPAPLPYIEGFAFSAFVPHNSFLFLWVDGGFLAPVSFLTLLGFALIIAGRRLRSQAASNRSTVVYLAFVSFAAMFPIFAYVDIAWDAPGLVMFGIACAATLNMNPADVS